MARMARGRLGVPEDRVLILGRPVAGTRWATAAAPQGCSAGRNGKRVSGRDE